MAYDRVIRNGTVVDGSGWPRYQADVGIVGDRIARIGRITERGAEEVDAEGHFVTPGFIDNHTHLDAQICWDPVGPAAAHGVTSSVMGNCGISLAPCRDEQQREIFVTPAMAVAEDVPRPTVDAAVPWEWETFPEYLEYVSRRPKGTNYAAQVGHGALRAYAMGERVFAEDPASDDDIAEMCRQLESALCAGAIGFTTMLETSMFLEPFQGTDYDIREVDPRVICGLASRQEFDALADVLARTGRGAIQMYGTWDYAVEISARTGALIQFPYGVIPPHRIGPRLGRPDFCLQDYDEAAERGAQIVAQIPHRPQTSIIGFRAKLPFDRLPVWSALRSRPLEEQRAALTDPVRRHQLLDIARNGQYPARAGMVALAPNWERLQILDRRLPPYRTVGQVAAETGQDPLELFVDLSLESDFHRLFADPLTYNPDRATWLEMFRHPRTVLSLADTGAHTGQGADWVAPTYFLGYWVREEREFTWEQGVRMFTFDPASVWGGLGGRGLVREGFVADLNVFDPETISPEIPAADNGLPAGGLRLTCDAIGVKATIVNGQVIYLDGEYTGAEPGRLLIAGDQRGTG